MSNRSPEHDYSQLPSALDFWLEQRLKQLHVATPAIVESYDAPTKRAKVVPAIRLLMTDGKELRQAPIVDVPVVHTGGGGLAAVVPLKPGDKVFLVFAQRGVRQFKRLWAEACPEIDSLFDRRDAFAFPMGTAKDIAPVDEDALVLQTEDGTDYVALKKGSIVLETTGTITLRSGGDVLVVQ